jgi:DNA repair protein RadD
MSLWDHQLRGMQELRAAYADGNSSVLCVAPCGSGKTRFATELCWSSIELGFRPLFVVHNGELMQQSIDAFRERGIDTGVIWSGHEMDLTRPMQIGTIQTLMRRELPSFDFLILDEAHLHMTRSARLLIERVKPGSILGLSASPTLLGGRSLGDLYTALRQLAQPSELIAKGILLEPTVYAPSHPDVLGVPTLGGDFDASKLIEVCNTTKLVGDITESYGRLEHKPQAILFAVDRSHSISCRDRLRGAGLRAEHIDGTTPKAERDALLDRFKRGDIDVLCNVNILSTGFNYPPLECVIIARPTQSEALHIQMCSRAFRSWHGKRKPVILDHSGNTVVRHGFAHADRDWSDALKPSKRKKTSHVSSLLRSVRAFGSSLSCMWRRTGRRTIRRETGERHARDRHQSTYAGREAQTVCETMRSSHHREADSLLGDGRVQKAVRSPAHGEGDSVAWKACSCA